MHSKVRVDVRDTFPITLCAPRHVSKLTAVPKPKKDNRKDLNLFLDHFYFEDAQLRNCARRDFGVHI